MSEKQPTKDQEQICSMCHKEPIFLTVTLEVEQETKTGTRTISIDKGLCPKCYTRLMEELQGEGGR